jgi:hypothetical protein
MGDQAVASVEAKVWGDYTQAQLDAQYDQMTLVTMMSMSIIGPSRSRKAPCAPARRPQPVGCALWSEYGTADIWPDKAGALIQIFSMAAPGGGRKSDVVSAELFTAMGAISIAVNYERQGDA